MVSTTSRSSTRNGWNWNRLVDALCSSDDPTEEQRAKIRRIVEAEVGKMQHLLAMAENAAQGVDPEAALVDLAALQERCSHVVAEGAAFLRRSA